MRHVTVPFRRIERLTAVLALVLAAAFSSPARADALPPVAGMVAKVLSGPCSSPSQFKGSGLLFNRGGARYVLTSEHVLLHGNQGICHSIELGSDVTARAELVAADWGFGLALLRLAADAPAAAAGAAWADLRPAVPAVGAPVLLAGYPARLRRQPPFVDPAASFATADSDGHLFPLVSTVEEVLGHGEFGMSGGGVFTADGRQLVGVLSHQFVRIVAGKPSTIAVFGEGSQEVENHLIVIPARAALAWVEQVLAAGTYRAVFERDVQDQMQGRDRIRVGGMRFEFVPPPPGDDDDDDNDGGGIGGMDGVGVGGDDQAAFADGTIHVTLSDPAAMGPWPFPALAGWATRLRQELQITRELDIVHLVSHSTRLRYASLQGFFRNAGLGARPVVLRAVPSGHPDRDAALLRLEALGRRAVTAAQALGRHDVDAAAHRLLQRALVAGQILTARDWDVVDLDELAVLRAAPEWSALFVADFDAALALLTALNKADDEIRRLAI